MSFWSWIAGRHDAQPKASPSTSINSTRKPACKEKVDLSFSQFLSGSERKEFPPARLSEDHAHSTECVSGQDPSRALSRRHRTLSLDSGSHHVPPILPNAKTHREQSPTSTHQNKTGVSAESVPHGLGSKKEETSDNLCDISKKSSSVNLPDNVQGCGLLFVDP